MRNTILGILFFICVIACKKSHNVPVAIPAGFATVIKVGSKVYTTENQSLCMDNNHLYRFDGKDIYAGYPSCFVYFDSIYTVALEDTSRGEVSKYSLITFSFDSTGSVSKYNSKVFVYFNDTGYIGSAIVSAEIFKNSNGSLNGTFELQGSLVTIKNLDSIPPLTLDSLAFSSSGTFTNAIVQ
jgi:hypothetical protein